MAYQAGSGKRVSARQDDWEVPACHDCGAWWILPWTVPVRPGVSEVRDTRVEIFRYLGVDTVVGCTGESRSVGLALRAVLGLYALNA